VSEDVINVRVPSRVEVTLTTENVGHVTDKLKLLMAAMMKVLSGAELEEIRRADFDEDPIIVMVVRDPIMAHLPHGGVRAEVRPLS
jgi:hypothetical protein